MTKQSVALVVAVGLAIGGEAAAAGYVDGPATQGAAICTSRGSSTDGPLLKVGHWIDPVVYTPKLGEVTYVHAVVTNKNPCDGLAVGLELFLPAGATFAIDSTHPVNCSFGNNAGLGGAVGNGPDSNCLQAPVSGNFGGSFFGNVKGSMALALGWSFEIQVPVKFSQQITSNPLSVGASTAGGGVFAGTAVTVPYQPAPVQWALGDDLMLIGGSLASRTMPVAFSNDDGTFTVTSAPVGDFAFWARLAGVQRLSGDFNGDGLTDVALVGGPGWQSIPVAMGLGDGQFTITNSFVGSFGNLFGAPGAKALAGDFNHDGRTDVALVGGNWSSIPVAFSTGNGNFNVTNLTVPTFPQLAFEAGAKPYVGDFNKDGFADIALVGGVSRTTVPIAFSYGNGTFLVTNAQVNTPSSWGFAGDNFAMKSRAVGAQVVTGDFNKDGYTDLAMTGGAGWTKIAVALSYGNGGFQMTFNDAGSFGGWASSPGVKVLAGDFNKDGYTDLALTGVNGWNTMPVAMNANFGNFTVTNRFVGDFAAWASTPGVRVVTGDYNGDGFTDVALTGGAGWPSIPVAFAQGGGNFTVTNSTVTNFPGWATDGNASVASGTVD